MFNAVNILEALKNYIRTRGGQSAANNIAEAVNDLNSIPHGSGGDIPSEVTNAIETGGIGWTESEELRAFSIERDPSVEPVWYQSMTFFKGSGEAYSINEFIGSTIVCKTQYEYTQEYEVTQDMISIDDNGVITIFPDEDVPAWYRPCVLCFPEDIVVTFEMEEGVPVETTFTKGVYLSYHPSEWVQHIYRYASTKEVVHSIAPQYLPEGGFGYTTEEEVEGFDIQWDGNTEGLEMIDEIHYKISDIPLTADDLLGGTVEFSEEEEVYTDQITQDYLIVDENYPMIAVGDSEIDAILVSIINDFSPISDVTVSKGLYAIKTTSEKETIFDKEINVNEFVESQNCYRGEYTLDGDTPLYAFANYAIFIDDVFVARAQAYSLPTGGVVLGTVPGGSHWLIEEFAGVRNLYWTESGAHTLRLEKIMSVGTQFLSVTKQNTTEEIVHQIDPKYITDAPVVVHFTIGEQGLKWDKWYDELQNITDRPIEGILTVDNGGIYNAQYDPQLKKFYIKTLEIKDDGTPIENVTAYIKAVAWDYGSPRWEFVEVTPSSGGGMVVTIDFDGSTGTADKTYDEIIAAVNVGTAIMFKALTNGELFMYIPFGVAFDMGDGLIISAKFEDVAITCESGTTWTMQG